MHRRAVYFYGPITSIFNAMRFDENPFNMPVRKKKAKRLTTFEILRYYGFFLFFLSIRHHGSDGVSVLICRAYILGTTS